MKQYKIIYCILFIQALCLTSLAQASIAIDRWQTSQGTPVIFHQAMDIPMLDIYVAFHAGSAYDDTQFGLSALTTRTLNQGNAGFSAAQIAEQLALTGAQYEAETTRDNIILHLRTLSAPKARFQAINTFKRIINHPDFPISAFVTQKNQQRLLIQHQQESPDIIANNLFFKLLYQHHPYAHPVDGSLEQLDTIHAEDLSQFYKHYFVKKNAVIAITGAINQEDAAQLAHELIIDLPTGQRASTLPNALALKQELNMEYAVDSSQTHLRLGQLGISYNDPDYFPLLVGNHILGGKNLLSWLSSDLREKQGLTYGVYSQFTPMQSNGPFIIELSTNQPQLAQTRIRDILTQFVKIGPDAQQLSDAKQYLVGSFPLSFASNYHIANILLYMALYNLPDDYLDNHTQRIQAVTREDILRAFQRHIHLDRLLSISVGKA